MMDLCHHISLCLHSKVYMHSYHELINDELYIYKEILDNQGFSCSLTYYIAYSTHGNVQALDIHYYNTLDNSADCDNCPFPRKVGYETYFMAWFV